MKVINSSQIFWKKQNEDVAVNEMSTEHIIRTMAWLQARIETLSQVKSKIPEVFLADVENINGYTHQEWLDIFSAELQFRAEKIEAEKNAEIEKMVAEKMAAIEAEKRVNELLSKK